MRKAFACCWCPLDRPLLDSRPPLGGYGDRYLRSRNRRMSEGPVFLELGVLRESIFVPIANMPHCASCRDGLGGSGSEVDKMIRSASGK